MKLNQLDNVLDKFLDNKELSVILINGSWGIGKTYKILSYRDNCNRKDVKFLYCSFFGKKNLDEINTVFYNQLHPCRKVLNVVNHVVKLAEATVSISSGLNLTFKNDSTNKDKRLKLKSKKKQLVVICDDLERVSKDIDKDDIIGYFNELILQGIKIVILAHIKKEDQFSEYKEKVVDRIYQISETQESIIKDIMGDNNNLFNNKLKKLINNNLRMLKKSIVLYNQIVCFLNENNIKFNDNDKLMSISICVVIEILTGELSQNYVNSLTEEGKKYLGWYTEEQIQANAIYKKLANDNILFNPSSDMTLIIAIINIYLQEDYGMLISYYNPISNDDNIFSSLFFDSDENKIIKVKKQYNYILNLTSKEVDTESIIENAICEWYTYGSFLDLSFIDETKLFTKLIELDITPDFTFRQTKDIIDFEKRFSVYKNQKIKEKIIIELNQFEKTKSFKEKIENIQSNFPVYDKEIKEEIKSNLLKNKFYVTDLNGDISPEYWSIVHSVCSLVGSNIRELIPNLLLDFGKLLIKYPNDKSLKSRIIGLKEQYKLDIKDIIE